jgi:hypothetical protein
MSLFDDVKHLIASSPLGTSTGGDPTAHFEQFAQSVDPATLAQGIAASLRSDETPPFAQLVSQLFSSASDGQKSTIVSTLLSSLSPEQRGHLATLIPGLGPDAVTPPDQAAALTPDAVQMLAHGVQQHDAGIVEKMGALCAAHPMLVKTLGAAALTVAMRHMAGGQRQRA